MYVRRSNPGLGSFFTQVRNMAEGAVAAYYPALAPLVAKPEALAAPAPAPSLAAEAAPTPSKLKPKPEGLPIPLILGGVAVAGGALWFFTRKKR